MRSTGQCELKILVGTFKWYRAEKGPTLKIKEEISAARNRSAAQRTMLAIPCAAGSCMAAEVIEPAGKLAVTVRECAFLVGGFGAPSACGASTFLEYSRRIEA